MEAATILICNFKSCQTELTNLAYVTTCNHIFCREHYDGMISSDHVKCLFCGFILKDPSCDIYETLLKPCDRFKTMILAGLSPDQIFDTCQRAINFWMYQSGLRERIAREKTEAMADSLVTVKRKLEYELNASESRNNKLQEEVAANKARIESLICQLSDKKREFISMQNRFFEEHRRSRTIMETDNASSVCHSSNSSYYHPRVEQQGSLTFYHRPPSTNSFDFSPNLKTNRNNLKREFQHSSRQRGTFAGDT